jgi:hypothetical protein
MQSSSDATTTSEVHEATEPVGVQKQSLTLISIFLGERLRQKTECGGPAHLLDDLKN